MTDFATIWALISKATVETSIMVVFSTLFSVLIGLPLGVILYATGSEYGLFPKPVLNNILSRVIDVLRSFPFVILMVVLFPLSRLILKTAIGTAATIIPLSIAAAPFVARVIESALKEVDPGVIQAARAIGSTNFQIIRKVLLPEALPALIDGLTLTIINIIGYSAMAGVIGGGGLGNLAINYGYQRFRSDILISAVLVILILVEVVQTVGTSIAVAMMKRR